jgi:hypothetical protein
VINVEAAACIPRVSLIGMRWNAAGILHDPG